MPTSQNADSFVTPRGTFPLIRPDDIEEFKLHPSMKLVEAVAYVCYPKDANEYQKVHEEAARHIGQIKMTYTYTLAVESIEVPVPTLRAIKRADGEYWAMPADFIAWADSKGCFVPKWLREIYPHQELGKAEPLRGGNEQLSMVEQFPIRPNTPWEDIIVTFQSEERVHIRAREQFDNPYCYSALGFAAKENHRSR